MSIRRSGSARKSCNATNISPTEFVGFQNYIDLFTRDRLFLSTRRALPTGALPNTILWVVVFTVGTVGIGLLAAVLSDAVKYGRVVKTVVFIPMAISFTATGIIWRFVYSPDPNIGILNAAGRMDILEELESIAARSY